MKKIILKLMKYYAIWFAVTFVRGTIKGVVRYRDDKKQEKLRSINEMCATLFDQLYDAGEDLEIVKSRISEYKKTLMKLYKLN